MHKYISTDKICTYCSMNKQWMKGVQKWKKVIFEIAGSNMLIAMLALQYNLAR